jgi:hypothetical protein
MSSEQPLFRNDFRGRLNWRPLHLTPGRENASCIICAASGDPKAVAYLVAVPDKVKAIDLIRKKFGSSGDQVEDLGRVSEALLTAMSLAPSEVVRVDGVRHVAQQQPQPQPN